MNQILMKGNEAIAESALRAGCRFFAGYPITPQSEILEYMAKHMPQRGGTFIQGESEVASISMCWGAAASGVRTMTSSSGPGFDLKQEGIAYIASYDLPAVIVSVMRYGIGGGDITAGQDSYLQATKGGGNGDYRLIVYAPNSVNECAWLTYQAFEMSEKYRNPVLILTDGAIGQMVELCTLPNAKEHDKNTYDWVIRGRSQKEKKNKATNINWYIGDEAWQKHVYDKLKFIQQDAQQWENFMVDDAELIYVAYGVSSRVCKQAVKKARAMGIKLGLIRPITLWPFPKKAFEHISSQCKGFLTVEMSIMGQMLEDIYSASKYRLPVYTHCTAINIPIMEDVLQKALDVLEGKIQVEEAL